MGSNSENAFGVVPGQQVGPFFIVGVDEGSSGTFTAYQILQDDLAGPFSLTLWESPEGGADAVLARARWTNAASHPNIVRTLQVGQVGARWFELSERDQGIRLDRLMVEANVKRASLPRELALAIGASLADCARRLHQEPTLFGPRRLERASPSQVLLTWDGRLRFRRSLCLDPEGNASHLAPELVAGAQGTFATDVWAVSRLVQVLFGALSPSRTGLRHTLGRLPVWLRKGLREAPADRLSLAQWEAEVAAELAERDGRSAAAIIAAHLSEFRPLRPSEPASRWFDAIRDRRFTGADAASWQFVCHFDHRGDIDDAPLFDADETTLTGSLSVEDVRQAFAVYRATQHEQPHDGASADLAEPTTVQPHSRRAPARGARPEATVNTWPPKPSSVVERSLEPSGETNVGVLEQSLDEPNTVVMNLMPPHHAPWAVRSPEEELRADAAREAASFQSAEVTLAGDVALGPSASSATAEPAADPAMRARPASADRVAALRQEDVVPSVNVEISAEATVSMTRTSVTRSRLLGSAALDSAGRAALDAEAEAEQVEVGHVFTASHDRVGVEESGEASETEVPVSASLHRDEGTEMLSLETAILPAPEVRPKACDDQPSSVFESASSQVMNAEATQQFDLAQAPRWPNGNPDAANEATVISAAQATATRSATETGLRPSPVGVEKTEFLSIDRGDAIEPERDATATPRGVEITPAEEDLGVLVVEVPSDAVVFVNGAPQGKGRVLIPDLNRYTEHQVRVHRRGFHPWTASVSLNGEQMARIAPVLMAR